MSLINYFFSRQNLISDAKTTSDPSTSVIEGWITHSKAPEWDCFFSPEIFIKWANDLKISIALQDMNAW